MYAYPTTIQYNGIPVSNTNPFPIDLIHQIPTGSNTIGSVNVNVKNSNVSDLNPFPIKIAAPLTSKDYVKVSASEVKFFNTFQYGIETDVWDTYTSNGGTALFSSNISGIPMIVNSQLNSTVIRQTHNVMTYIPGRTTELTFGIRFTTPEAGIRRRIGLFNGSDGFYFEDNGGDYACVLINSSSSNGIPYMERISRADWNGDHLDGLGESKITADPEAMQMISFEYEWYGAGQIIFKYIINGHPRIIHTLSTGNRLPFPWSKTPFLPIRLEITNIAGIAGSHYLYQFSNSLANLGISQKTGVSQSILTPLVGINMPNAKTFYPIISIRLKPTALQGVVIPTFFQTGTFDNTSVFYKLIRNTSITDGTWVDMTDPNSFTQYNISSALPISGGVDLETGIVATGSSVRVALDKTTELQIGRSSLGTVSDTLTLAVAGFGANKDAVGSLTWIEQR